MRKTCETCEHENLAAHLDPCLGCLATRVAWEPKAPPPRRRYVEVGVSVNGEKVHEERIYDDQPKPVGAWNISWGDISLGDEPATTTPPCGGHLVEHAEYARLRTNADRLDQVQARLADIRASLVAAQSDSRTLLAFIDDTIKRAGG